MVVLVWMTLWPLAFPRRARAAAGRPRRRPEARGRRSRRAGAATSTRAVSAKRSRG